MASYILHLPKWFPNEDDNLEGVFVLRHIQCSSYKHSAKIIYLRSTSRVIPGSCYYSNVKTQDSNEIHLIYYKKRYLGINSIDKIIKLFVYYYLMLKYCRQLFHEFGKPYAIHVHVLLRPALVALYYKFVYSVPYVITEHSTQFTDTHTRLKNDFKNLIRRYIVRKADAIIAVSDNLKNGMMRYGLINSNYLVVYNNVDTFIYFDKPKKPTLELKCLHVSEFKNEHKNITGILEVMLTFKQQVFPIVLDLVGYGQDKQLIQDFITQNKLEPYVRLLGKLDPVDLARCYQAADVFVLFSNKENMPCVIAESLCCGTPVISTEVGGIAEVISPENGILIPVNDKVKLKKTLEEFYVSRHRYSTKNISVDAISKFSDRAIGEKIMNCYESLSHCG
ncbi:MAG: glycosyltransferase [Saprospiraceae bacterium]|nr:glycosyltransferase [Saprospiraceae bacterium]